MMLKIPEGIQGATPVLEPGTTKIFSSGPVASFIQNIWVNNCLPVSLLLPALNDPVEAEGKPK